MASDIMERIYEAEQQAKAVVQKGDADALALKQTEAQRAKDEAEALISDARSEAQRILSAAQKQAQQESKAVQGVYAQKSNDLDSSAQQKREQVIDELLNKYFEVDRRQG